MMAKFAGIRRGFISTLVGICLLLVGSSIVRASGVRATPQVIFCDDNQKSVHLTLMNPSNGSIEVWFEFKYGFSTINDSGKIVVTTPDSLQADDRSAADWVKAYPSRFTLGPQETQVVRMVVTPTSDITPGEYWTRLIVKSRDNQLPSVKGVPSLQTSFIVISANSLPFHYRYKMSSTGIQLSRPIEYRNTTKSFIVSVPIHRTGNASYWGSMTCKLINSAGKQIFTNQYNLAVYKDLVYPIQIDKTNITPGDYTLEISAKTEHPEIKKTTLTKADPVSWILPVKIQ